MAESVVTVERVIAAPSEKIFDLLANPADHPRIDGSGSVKQVKDGSPQRLGLGSTFGMSMKLGIPYSMVSEVVEFEDNKVIAWQSRPPGSFARLAGGRIWRYELEPLDDGRTRVTESWDVSRDKWSALLRIGPTPKQTRKSMEATLERIEELLSSG
jgi:uncharacterized protein YndB with AHSA1/START domain